jgi:hypothetical protein
VIDPTSIDALNRIARRADDVMHAYDPAFRPQSPDVARSQGPALVSEADPLSVAPPRGTYFLVKQKSGETVMTLDGGFRFVDGTLQTRDGATVLGFSGTGRSPEPLRAATIDVALKRVGEPRIDGAGFVSCRLSSIDPVTGAARSRRAVVGRVALAALPAGSEPQRLDGAHLRPPKGVRIRLGVPGTGEFGVLATHVRQLGGVDMEAGLDRLREAYMEFEALEAAHRSTATIEKAAMDLLK